MSITVTNLSTLAELSYMATDSHSAIKSVTHAYCTSIGKVNDWIQAHRDNQQDSFYKSLPVTVGKKTIACGDFATTT